MTAVTTETLQVSGIRCERCVHRLAAALSGHEGLESANANLMGQVTLSWDEELTTRAALLEVMARGGFHPQTACSRNTPASGGV
jgi:copper chaperone CopZ